jgi:uncharacterized protein DUF4124
MGFPRSIPEAILAITTQLPAAVNTNVILAPIRRLCFAVPFFVALLAPTIAWGDIYKWTDERGNTVISNVRPTHLARVTNFEVTVEEMKGTAVATPTERMLLDKLDRLERQLLAQQYAQQVAVAPPVSAYGSYNPALPPPPPPPGYYSAYSSLLSYPYAFYPATTIVTRPRFAFAHNGIRGGSISIHRGRR